MNSINQIDKLRSPEEFNALMLKLKSWQENGPFVTGFFSDVHAGRDVDYYLFIDQLDITDAQLMILFGQVRAAGAQLSLRIAADPNMSRDRVHPILANFFNEIYPKIFENQSCYVTGLQQHIEGIDKLMKRDGDNAVGCMRTLAHQNLFYLTDSTIERMKTEPLIDAPNGFYFDRLTLDDLPVVLAGSDSHVDQSQREKYIGFIEKMPNCCIRTDVDDKVAAVGFLHSHGMLHNLYVVPEHRRKGLGHKLEHRLVQSLLRHQPNYQPYKFVVYDDQLAAIFTHSQQQKQLWSTASHTYLFARYEPIAREVRR